MRPDPLVRATSMSRMFGSGDAVVGAVVDATFAIGSGDRIALVGPSGSGKSTMLHLISGIDRPTAGSIEWPAIGERAHLRPGPVALAFQGPSLLPALTVEENVALPLLLEGRSRAEAAEAANRLIDAFDLDGVVTKLPEQLSGGQMQRAALARAFTGSPRLVLADEPTGQQDGASATRVMDVALELAMRCDAAFVIATHDEEAADRLPIRWSMDGGRLRSHEVPCSS